jgi:NAD(P)-dependent dehydrogenase (short-subunit alcohol dehydrogenase family)
LTGRLDGEVAVVTGSTSGLGKEIARLFAAEGAQVIVTGRDRSRGEGVVRVIADKGGSAMFVAADLTDATQRQHLVEAAVSAVGTVTVLVNNAVAGAGGDGPVGEVGVEAWRAGLEVDLVAAADLCRLVLPVMLAGGHGAIVNISSRVAERGTPGLAVYTAAKGGLNALARSITADYARRGVRCNTVQPGYILHERRDAELTAERRARIEGMHLTRVPTATDVAYAALFLASREAEVISGITLPVDGGSTAVRGVALG